MDISTVCAVICLMGLFDDDGYMPPSSDPCAHGTSFPSLIVNGQPHTVALDELLPPIESIIDNKVREAPF